MERMGEREQARPLGKPNHHPRDQLAVYKSLPGHPSGQTTCRTALGQMSSVKICRYPLLWRENDIVMFSNENIQIVLTVFGTSLAVQLPRMFCFHSYIRKLARRYMRVLSIHRLYPSSLFQLESPFRGKKGHLSETIPRLIPIYKQCVTWYNA